VDTVGPWALVRFAHVAGAALWVGGQLALSLVILPLARRLLAPDTKDRFTAEAGRRFGMLTGALFLPVQLGTGLAMAWHKGVTWASLAEPGHGRTLAVKLALFALVTAGPQGGDAGPRHSVVPPAGADPLRLRPPRRRALRAPRRPSVPPVPPAVRTPIPGPPDPDSGAAGPRFRDRRTPIPGPPDPADED
jgi:hypothetical protein